MAVEVEHRPVAPPLKSRVPIWRKLGRDFVLGYTLLIPLILILFLLLAYPIASAIWITLPVAITLPDF